jgi:predicted O-linked N-acetylglucosamine transferase (SPINDLY family)
MESSPDELFRLAMTSFQAGRLSDAERSFKELLRKQPTHLGALNLLGILFITTQKHEEAERYLKQAIALNAQSDATLSNYGIALKALKRPQEALESFDRALAINPGIAGTWTSRGAVLNDLKRHEEAIADFDRAIALQPNYAEAYSNKGKSLSELRRYGDALAAYDEALKRRPALPEALAGRGNALSKLRRYSEAASAFDSVLSLNPGFAEAWLGRGNILFQMRQYDEALAAYDKAISIKPGLVEAWLGRGYLCSAIKRPEDALAAFDRAVAIEPAHPDGWLGRGYALNDLKRHKEAGAAYAKALAIDPRRNGVKGSLLHQKLLACEWDGVEQLVADIEADLEAGHFAAEPFAWQGVARSERSLYLCSTLFATEKFPPADPTPRHDRPAGERIRVGYVSGEFREQATSLLLVGVLEEHDASRFEIIAFDNGWADGSQTRGRIEKAVSRIVGIRQMSDAAAAAEIARSGIDILVNLNGYFGEHRTQLFARRPASIQVNYLGFPGTLGAPYFDYIVADQTVLPIENRPFFSEKVACLPNCYQANDRKRQIGDRAMTRAEFGLPDSAFVFCCFNNIYKILPDVFSAWMRILANTPGSVLWLIEDNAEAVENLRKEAAARNIARERLIFAKRLPLRDHLARHRLADLFLDTTPCNAHTTASDALWAGLPVLTCMGNTFTSRVATSLLKAVGLPELATTGLESYEELAVSLAADPRKLDAIRKRLADNRLTAPLFDTPRYTRDLEAIYDAMYRRHRSGLAPDDIPSASGSMPA